MLEDRPAFTEEWGDLSCLTPLKIIQLALLARGEGLPLDNHGAQYVYNFVYQGRALQFNDSLSRDDMLDMLMPGRGVVLAFPQGGRSAGGFLDKVRE